MGFFVITLLAFLSFLGYPYEIMDFLKKYWREILLGVSILINIILSVWIGVINKSNPEAEFKIKHYDVLIKEKDSVANESIKYQRLLAEKGKQYEDSISFYKTFGDKQVIYIHDIKDQKNEEISRVDGLDVVNTNNQFCTEAELYRNSR